MSLYTFLGVHFAGVYPQVLYPMRSSEREREKGDRRKERDSEERGKETERESGCGAVREAEREKRSKNKIK